MEVDLGALRLVTAVATQGRHANGQGQEYTPAYTLSFWRPGMQDFIYYSAHPNKANKVNARSPFVISFSLSYVPSTLFFYCFSIYPVFSTLHILIQEIKYV